jgi:excinuclease ABC subunit A
VRVHNLKGIDVSIPLGKMTVITGVSGSGKSSLAFDTLFTEGQRRYIESFPADARRVLARLERPDADRIDHVPPAIAFRQDAGRHAGPRTTVATITEVHDALRVLFARFGQIVCPGCRAVIRHENAATVREAVLSLPEGARWQIAFPRRVATKDIAAQEQALRERGFVRVIRDGQTQTLGTASAPAAEPTPSRSKKAPASASSEAATAREWLVIVDRLTAGKVDDARCLESLETAFSQGDGNCVILVEAGPDEPGSSLLVDDRGWTVRRFSEELRCGSCGIEFVEPEPRLFSFHSPLGACRTCHGTGVVASLAAERLIDGERSPQQALATFPSESPSDRVVQEFLANAAAAGVPVDRPISTWTDEEKSLFLEGTAPSPARRKRVAAPKSTFAGLRCWLRELEENTHRPGVRGILRMWRVARTCSECHGNRLQPAALAVHLGALNIAELCQKSATEAIDFLADAAGPAGQTTLPPAAAPVREDAHKRLQTLIDLGVGDVPLDRSLRALSGGEARRTALAATLSTALVRALYVLDEPAGGMHPVDAARILAATRTLRDRGNTVIVVEHDETFFAAADHLVEIGPGAGLDGGRVTFAGPPVDLEAAPGTATGPWLSGERQPTSRASRRDLREAPRLRLTGCRANNLQGIDVDVPLGSLCVVSGVSGAGKTSLVGGSLLWAASQLIGRTIAGATDGSRAEMIPPERGQIPGPPFEDVALVDQSPLPGSLRSTPVTSLKAFDPIRVLFAQTQDSQVRNYGPSHFAFNASDGRCPKCEGTGRLTIDMQFLADVFMTCPECDGARYQREVLQVKYRGLNIAEVLAMTVREAWAFFSKHPKVVKRLQPLRDVGLGYLPLGQSVATLSGGERQRLKLAMRLASRRRVRTLFLLDEPTTGLHRSDVATLIACFDGLLAIGHSLVVIENDADVLKAADWIIELGPGGGSHGGRVVWQEAPN